MQVLRAGSGLFVCLLDWNAGAFAVVHGVPELAHGQNTTEAADLADVQPGRRCGVCGMALIDAWV